MPAFEKGHSIKSPGRKGAKNRLSLAFLQALCEDFEQNGIEAIKICRIEKPNEYLRLIAYCLPKELEVTIGPLQEISIKNLSDLLTTPDENSSTSLVLQTLKAEKERRHTENRLVYYRPYDKQRDFHAVGATHRERLLLAGNQLGKTLAGGFEAAMHSSGGRH